MAQAAITPVAFSQANYHLQVSDKIDDPRWDAFLALTAGGSYPQTTMWARTKIVAGFRPIRIVATQGGTVIGGMQILTRRFPIIGGYGYVAMGPLLAPGDMMLGSVLIDALHEVAEKERIQYVVVQPPAGADAVTDSLRVRGFFPTSREVAPSATLLIDLHQSHDEIMAGMLSKTRQNIRFGERHGLVVREGKEGDIALFHRLLVATSKRQNFCPAPAIYYRELWRLLAPRDFVKLFVAEAENESVAALMVICFGNTVVDWRVGWSGRHGKYHPNEAMRWAVVKWAKERGYRYHDIGGIHRNLARLMAAGEPIPKPMAANNHFKIQFGGKPALYPRPYGYIYNPLLRLLDSVPSAKVREYWPLKPLLELLH